MTHPAPAQHSPAPSANGRWADRLVGAAAGAGLFAAGLASADALGPGSRLSEARADMGVREVAAVREALDAEQDRPLLDGGDALARVSRLASPSVVHIESRYDDGDGDVEETGSGVLVRHPNWPGLPASRDPGRLFVLTNRHVVAGGYDARESGDMFVSAGTLGGIDLKLANQSVVRPKRLWTDAETDLAVLEIENVDLPAIRFGDSDALEPGHFVMALGSPFGLDRSVSLGIISATGRRRLDLGSTKLINQDFLQTDAAINPGNSGGPLVDLRGRLVGINTAIASSSGGSEGIGFSIPVNLARRVFDELLTHGRVRRSYLGVHLAKGQGLSQYEARTAGLPRAYGAEVSTLIRDTPAARAGLRARDVVLQFGEVDVEDADHLIHLVSLTPLGDRVKLLVLRDGRRIPLTIALDKERVARG